VPTGRAAAEQAAAEHDVLSVSLLLARRSRASHGESVGALSARRCSHGYENVGPRGRDQ